MLALLKFWRNVSQWQCELVESLWIHDNLSMNLGSLDLDQKEREKENHLHQKENRIIPALAHNPLASTSALASQQLLSVKSEKKSERKSSVDKTGSGGIAYSLGHIGVGSTAIAAAASQAIAATQQVFVRKHWLYKNIMSSRC